MRSDLKGLAILVGLAAALTLLSYAALTYGRPSTESLILGFAPHHSDLQEAPKDRAKRVGKIARAIDAATAVHWERALLVSVAWHESRFASGVQECRTLGDNGKAAGLWQTHAVACPFSEHAQAREAIRHLKQSMNLWRRGNLERRIVGGVSTYATGKRQIWKGANKRLDTWKGLMKK